LGVGGITNTKLATDAGLNLVKGRRIWLDEYMRTIDPDIFAAGDCGGSLWTVAEPEIEHGRRKELRSFRNLLMPAE
jgi:NADPH-dependent 2,4-dienoyl-CoA reductase/sulfur reductase-like enzyme